MLMFAPHAHARNTMRLSDVLQLLDSSDEDMLNRPGSGTRQRAGSIHSALGVLNASATKSTSLLNKELSSERLQELTQLCLNLTFWVVT